AAGCIMRCLIPGRPRPLVVEKHLPTTLIRSTIMVMGPAWDRAKAHHMGCFLPRKLPAVVATVCLLITLPGIALAHSNRPTLLQVHVLKVSHDRATGTANCSNQPNNPGNGGFVLTGWQVLANVAASLNAATIP